MVTEAIEISRKISNVAGLAIHTGIQAVIAVEADHDPHRAVVLAEESLNLAVETESPEATLDAYHLLGAMRRHAGDTEGAETALRHALKLEAELGGKHGYVGETELELAAVALDKADMEEAVRQLTAHANLVRALVEDDETLAYSISGADALYRWALVATNRQRPAIAVTLLAAREAYIQENDTPRVQSPHRRGGS